MCPLSLNADEENHARFMKHVERTLLAKPTEANLGGVPSVQNKIRAYINVKYSKMGQWTASNLEVRKVSKHRHRFFLNIPTYLDG